jgi:hypothetical protein
MANPISFRTIDLPTGRQARIPGDISIVFPEASNLTPRQRQATAFIPWEERYFAHIPKAYRPFFEHTLPHLNYRTSDVHTALSIAQLPFLLEHSTSPANARIAYLATILHDTGWSMIDMAGIAASLSYSGVALSEASHLSKAQHVLIGAAMAYDLLDTFDFGHEPLFEAAKRHISQIIRRTDYDAPWERGNYPHLSTENKIVCDADRLWSYTHENFWQDTIRKDVEPEDYLLTLTGAIDNYFITPQGKVRAHGMIADRRHEVEQYLGSKRRQNTQIWKPKAKPSVRYTK